MSAVPTRPDPAAAGHVTPVMAQFIEIKAANPNCLLFYRMGDFYELFFDDAVVASRALGIALTKRGQHLGQDIPMAGVPLHAADDYLQRLIRLGHRVAICEQLEDPAEARKRGAKAVVKRDVVRIITPGTLTEDRHLAAREANHLAAVSRVRTGAGDSFGVAWLDVSTGAFRVAETAADGLEGELARIAPSEIVVPDALLDDDGLRPLWRAYRAAVTPVPRTGPDAAAAERRLAGFFGLRALDGFGRYTPAELVAAATAVAYLERTQLAGCPPLQPPTREGRGDRLDIEPAARANLEILRTLGGERAGSLVAEIDRTVTAAGGRELAARLAAPLADPAAIGRRLDAVEALVAAPLLRGELREALGRAPDMARALARLLAGRGGPRDLAAMRDGLGTATAVAALLAGAERAPERFAALAAALRDADPALARGLAAMLADELPLLRRDGGFVRAGHAGELDRERALRDDARGLILGLQAEYAEATGIRNLRVKHNGVLGYFVEVGEAQAPRLREAPHAETFHHRQTLASQLRFSTAALAELEARIAGAAERALALELALFDAQVAALRAAEPAIRAAAAALAEIDVHAALADLAASRNWTRPAVDGSTAFRVEGGRHPVVEAALQRAGEGAFVANDCDLGGAEVLRGAKVLGGGERDLGAIWLLTGPNMAGKSTFLRQNALIAILAQAGAFVPARSAHIGVVDRLFSRVGAADDLARGRSTFMVEMVETAAILNQATERSLVILDEIGRGTATFDGLSIAWATVEHLHGVNRCRALFATHFHELTLLQASLDRLEAVTMRVKEWQGDVVFLHEVGPGAADRSYGIQVAKLAGLPPSVVARARAVLTRLEEDDRTPRLAGLVDDLPLFAAAQRHKPEPASDPLADALAAVDPDRLTPREALDALYRLKDLAGRQG